MLRSILRWLPHSQYLYRFCRAYVDEFRNENNADMRSNGEARFLEEVLPDCRLVFDVGANVGEWAQLALRVNPGMSLHCFEPSRATYEKLLSNAFPENVICNNFGLGSAPGDVELFVLEDGSGLNSLYRREGLEDGWGIPAFPRRETIRLETVDDYVSRLGIEDQIDLCKMDVEGHELEVLKGMRQTLARGQVAMIQFEYGGCNIDARVLLKDIFGFFDSLGYELLKILPSGLRPVVRYDQRLENFQYQNWVARRRRDNVGDRARPV